MNSVIWGDDMKKVAFYTLGCKVNQYETEAMKDLFKKNKYEIVDSDDIADVYIINTCTVTNLSERKSRQFIRKAKKKNENSIIGVVGCYAQISPDEVIGIEEVDFILGTKDRNKIVEISENVKSEKIKINAVDNIMQTKEFEEMNIDEVHGKTRAFIKIQEGCNQFCSYCIIPYARGPIRSRKLESIIKEVQRLSENGFKEIVLTGIHIASYGKDIGDVNLLNVLEKIHIVKGIERIRLGSLEPSIITEDFMKSLNKLSKVCDHFHLSLQSGSDTVLRRMNRKYSTEEFKNKVELIRKYMPDAGITTDIIVGFPGETDEEFIQTYNFVKEIAFSKVHVFKYSPRKGTPAAKYKDQIDGTIKNIRSKNLIELTDKLTLDFNQRFVNKTVEVLFEDEENKKKNYSSGYTTNYIRIILTNENIEGKILKVELKELKDDSILGNI